MVMKVPKNLVVPALIVLVIVVVAVILFTGSGKTLAGVSKSSCDYRFLEWCKKYPAGGVDYDNFANDVRECKENGSYRTCEQVNEALG